MTETKTETWVGPCALAYPDGTKLIYEREAISWDDWRDTILGPVNFGKVVLGPQRLVRIEP